MPSGDRELEEAMQTQAMLSMLSDEELAEQVVDRIVQTAYRWGRTPRYVLGTLIQTRLAAMEGEAWQATIEEMERRADGYRT